MTISVASGKGGTGKTTVATNLALSLDGVQFLDCDVEEPNAHIFLKPEFDDSQPVFVPIPEVDQNRCTYCGRCSEVCEYNAIAVLKDNVLVFPELCTGCGGCSLLCPEGAISEGQRQIGVIEEGKAGAIDFIHGRVHVGEPRATPLIRQVKRRTDGNRTTIIDVPPGTSCPVIESVRGSDFCLLVTEPTPFGLNDLSLAVGLLHKMAIPMGVVINRSDGKDGEIVRYCRRHRIPILMRIPVEREIAVAYSNGVPFIYWKRNWRTRFKNLYLRIERLAS